MFSRDEQILVRDWLTRPKNYTKRPDVTNIMKKYYNQKLTKSLLENWEKTFEMFSKSILSKMLDNNEGKYIQNAERCLINCIRFGDNSEQGLLLYTFFIYPPLIGDFWLFVFCGEPILSQDTNQKLPQNTPTTMNPSDLHPAGQQYFSNQPNQSFSPNSSYQQPPNYQPQPSYQQPQFQLSSNYQIPQANPPFDPKQPFSFNRNQPNYLNSTNQQYFGNQDTSTSNYAPNVPPNQNLIKAENPDKFVDSLCEVIEYASETLTESGTPNEFINYFLSRFLNEGLKKAAKKLNSHHLSVIITSLQKFLRKAFTNCHCEICFKSFCNCCHAFYYAVQASRPIDNISFICSEINFIVGFLDDLYDDESSYPPNFLNCFLENSLIRIDPKFFRKDVKNILSKVLEIGDNLTNDITDTQPDLMKNCMDYINKIFNLDNINYYIDDSDLITRCIRFFYLNRFYEPFHGITQRIANKNLKSKIELDNLADIIADSLAEEDQDEIEGDNENSNEIIKDKEYKEYVRFFNDLKGKGKKKKNEPLIDARFVDENIEAGIKRAYQMNLNDIIIVSPIADSCKEAFQALFNKQVFEDLDAEQGQEQNINLFWQSNEKLTPHE